MNWEILLSIAGAIGGLWLLSQQGVWWLSQKFNDIHKLIDDLSDIIREDEILNNNKWEKERDRITALKYSLRDILTEQNHRISDIENFLFKQGGFTRRAFNDTTPGTDGGDFNSDDWTDIK